ncbi:hypothetical protein KGF56_004859 [Candida oxycetoniae]|uniref:SYO1-like TPR repeats domain-containing protein n=1 Tax=Candida oxycetoniae TaxID=497107 RepID=A0AAI9SSS6_9ASCO|nr:uncharacterized protein KGF56_004859 [Candida oxycetoniae]KAI3402289.2 hypothetical protein KGF56_004859 [Candida oxycetoniae]
MGKLRKGKRNQKARLNPLTSNSQQEKKKDEATRQSKILPLLNKLRSTVPNDKSMALGAITVLAEDQRMRQLLLKERLVQIVMETCLNDSNDETTVEAFGLLRNLGIEEGRDVAKHLWRQGIWTTIENALNKINESFNFLRESDTLIKDKSKVQLLYDFCENILSLVVVLASGDEQLYAAVFAKIDPVLELILKLVEDHISGKLKLSSKLFNTLLEFLYEFSIESGEFIEKLSAYKKWDDLSSFVENCDSDLAKVYLEGIKISNYEVLSTRRDNKQMESCTILGNIYRILTSIDLEQLIKRLDIVDKTNMQVETIDKHSDSIEKESVSNEVRTKLSAIENGLAIITSILEFMSVNEEEPEEPIRLTENIENVLLNEIEPMLTVLLETVLQEPRLNLQDQVLDALNNLSWLFLSNEKIPLLWYEKTLKIWDLVITLLNSHFEKSSLNIIWAIIKCQGPLIVKKIPPALIEKLLKENDANYDLFPSVLGVLGAIAPSIENTETTYHISQFLLTSITKACEDVKNPIRLEIIIESLNSLYDIFGDKDFAYDFEIFVDKNYLAKLKAIEPCVRDVCKKIDKNKDPLMKLRMEETWNNLKGFIAYKASERG